MDVRRPDALAKMFSGPDTRRRVLSLLATLPPLGGLFAILRSPEEAAAKDRRRRRKQRHKRRQHAGSRKDKKDCRPKAKATVCAGKCGTVKSRQTCGKPVDCGSCACTPPCGECFACQGAADALGTCVPQAAGTPCGDAATCEEGVIFPQSTCNGSGVCTVTDPVPCAPYTQCDGNACATSCSGDAECSDFCCNGTCQECCAHDDCSNNALCVDGECRDCDVTCTSGTPAACGEALQAALENAGLATVHVCPGTYEGGFEIARNVNVIGAEAGQTILDGNDDRRVMAITANGPVTLQALTITRGADDFGGGGIYNLGDLTLIDAAVSDNHMTSPDSSGGGGGVISYNALSLRNTLVNKNSSPWRGGGIFIDTGSCLLESGARIEENDGNFGGGISVDSGTVTLQAGSQVVDNTAARGGGGIQCSEGGVTLQAGSKVAHNTSGEGGGGLSSDPGAIMIETGVVICQNSVPQCDGTITGPGACPYPADNICPA